MKEKYGVDREAVLLLIKLGLCTTEEAALEKVASGEAEGLIKEAAARTTREEANAGRSK
jgi:hypothetical protein